MIELKEKQFNINIEENSTKLYELLADKLYENPKKAVIRELIANALDSHKKANSRDPIKIVPPTKDSPFFVVEDFGTGMTEDEMFEIYGSYFTSTKEGDNLNGFYGLGAKSPFAITDIFFVTSYKDGKETRYKAIKKDGIPHLLKIVESKTIRENGLIVKVPIRYDSSINEFYKTIISVLHSVDSKLVDVFKLYDKNSYTSAINQLHESYVEFENENVMIVPKGGKSLISCIFDERQFRYDVDVLKFMQGIYPYTLDAELLFPNWQKTNPLIALSELCIFKFNPNEIAVSSSREKLLINENNLQIIRKKVITALNEIKEHFKKMFINNTSINSNKLFKEFSGFIYPSISDRNKSVCSELFSEDELKNIDIFKDLGIKNHADTTYMYEYPLGLGRYYKNYADKQSLIKGEKIPLSDTKTILSTLFKYSNYTHSNDAKRILLHDCDKMSLETKLQKLKPHISDLCDSYYNNFLIFETDRKLTDKEIEKLSKYKFNVVSIKKEKKQKQENDKTNRYKFCKIIARNLGADTIRGRSYPIMSHFEMDIEYINKHFNKCCIISVPSLESINFYDKSNEDITEKINKIKKVIELEYKIRGYSNEQIMDMEMGVDADAKKNNSYTIVSKEIENFTGVSIFALTSKFIPSFKQKYTGTLVEFDDFYDGFLQYCDEFVKKISQKNYHTSKAFEDVLANISYTCHTNLIVEIAQKLGLYSIQTFVPTTHAIIKLYQTINKVDDCEKLFSQAEKNIASILEKDKRLLLDMLIHQNPEILEFYKNTNSLLDDLI